MPDPPILQTLPIETDRLLLSPHRPDDLDAVHRLRGDSRVVRHIAARPLNREEAWSRLLRYAGHWRLLGHGHWAVTERRGGRLVGEVGFQRVARTTYLDDDVLLLERANRPPGRADEGGEGEDHAA